MVHVINRLLFEVNYADEEEAFKLRKNYMQTYHDQIEEAISHVCRKYVPDDEWIRIDKLEIDLGRFSRHSFEHNFSNAFRKAFEKELIVELNGLPLSQRFASQRTSYFELFTCFLKNGILPWWAEEAEINLPRITQSLLKEQSAEIQHFFSENLHRRHIWERVVTQLPYDIKIKILSIFGDLTMAKSKFETWIVDMNEFMKDSSVILNEKQTESIVDTILENAPVILGEDTNNKHLLILFKEFLAQAMDEAVCTENQKNDVLAQAKILIEAGDEHMFGKREGLSSESHGSKPDSADISSGDDYVEKIHVKDAGIILLAPFLKEFFSKTGLLDDITWKTKDSLYRAIHLLKFLGTGEQNQPEYSLVLEKIICGLPLEETVPVDVAITKKEIEEAGLLLASVIENWKALKNTSVNGLRETYLKRKGLLSFTGKDWLLQIERKTWDVLLDKIPWGYATVYLPWNNYLIATEW